MSKLVSLCLGVFLCLGLAPAAWAGGSGLNVFIIVNQNSSNSVQLGNYYREQRQVPLQNFLRVNWTGGNVLWSATDFTNTILNPFLAALSSRKLTNQIDYVVLSMDFPYRVNDPSTVDENSTTSCLYYGFKPDTNPPCSLAPGSLSAYAGSECIFRSTPPISGASNFFLVTMITDTNLARAKAVVDHGVLGDVTFPTNTVYLGKSSDMARNIRFYEFDNTVFNTRLRGNYSVVRTNNDDPHPLVNMLGYENGLAGFALATNAFIPGAMADSLTSFGGQLFQPNDQTTLLTFQEAGAAGSYGTITEPCNYPDKFPDSQTFFYQARGFSLAECYYQAVTNPYQVIVAGEPLSAPFALPASAAWVGLASNAVLSATTNLSLRLTAPDALHPVQQVDLFLDGQWLQTVTNLPPHQGDVLNVTLNGHPTNYTVAASATIKSVTSNLVAILNRTAYSNATKVWAMAHGDRIELQSLDQTKTGNQISIAASVAVSPQDTTAIVASRSNFLDSIAWGYTGYWLTATSAVPVGSTLTLAVTKTNGAAITLSTTNAISGASILQFAQQFVDLINTNNSPSLQGGDGLTAEDLQSDGGNGAVFNLRARGQGFAASQIKAVVQVSAGLSIFPSTTNTLTDNLSDLNPRNHLYIMAGATNLPVTFPFNTTSLPDGWHELAAVGYEGSHVRTQARATRNVRIQNSALSATFTTLFGGSNTALGATLQFSVVANTNGISRIELFSTGGSVGVVSNQPSATFSLAATNLDLGLHPFYAVVTASSGMQYRTETTWIRIIGTEPPFTLQVSASPTTLRWPATAGRSYDILATTNLNNSFQLRATLVPSNSVAQWIDTNASSAQLFYRVRVTP